jgi:3-oxoacyl-[acyl-carrier protein] reductase
MRDIGQARRHSGRPPQRNPERRALLPLGFVEGLDRIADTPFGRSPARAAKSLRRRWVHLITSCFRMPAMFDLAGSAALVTGASGGIGAAIARALHGQGAGVALSGTRVEVLEGLARELGERAHAVPADLSHDGAADSLVAAAEAALGRVDILINNAGITRDNLGMRMKDSEWDEVLAVDLTAAFRLSRAVMRGMIKRRYGRIVSITSVVGLTGNAGQANYAAAKAGLAGMSKALAQELAGRNITVNCVAPGFIETAMTAVLDDKRRAAVLTTVPMGRLGLAEEVAAAVAFLASREASYVTGQTIHVNGGMVMI